MLFVKALLGLALLAGLGVIAGAAIQVLRTSRPNRLSTKVGVWLIFAMLATAYTITVSFVLGVY
ncbi:MAG: hypothetical protein ACLFWF_05110 [Alphaproteobacteria bacterium]